MFNYFYKMKNNKRGSLVIMEIVTLLIIVLVFAAFADLVLISIKYLYVSKLANDVARTVAVQSGLRTTAPANYPGGARGYHNTGQVLNFLSNNLAGTGVTNFTLALDGTIMTSNRSRTYAYKDRIRVYLTAHYEWRMLQNFIPILRNRAHRITVEKTVYAEYHF